MRGCCRERADLGEQEGDGKDGDGEVVGDGEMDEWDVGRGGGGGGQEE